MAKMTKKQKQAASRRRNRSKGLNVLSVTEGYLQTGVWTEKLFHANPFEFATGVVGGRYRPGADGGDVITVPELLTGFAGGDYADSPIESVKRNIAGKKDASITEVGMGLVWPAVQTALIGAGFKFGRKMTSKPRAAINRGIRQLGLGDLIRF
jgi:hypothetical protein